jgi:hypothetical protein
MWEGREMGENCKERRKGGCAVDLVFGFIR